MRPVGHVAELADAEALGASGAILAGSSPVVPTNPLVTCGRKTRQEGGLNGVARAVRELRGEQGEATGELKLTGPGLQNLR